MRLKLLRKQKHMSQLSLAMKLNTTADMKPESVNRI